MGTFELAIAPDASLVLAEPRFAEEYHALVQRNLARLARWEAWATYEQSLESSRAYLSSCMHAYADGTQVPAFLRVGTGLVGRCGLGLDGYAGAGSIGYWIDAAYEGRGLVTAAARALALHGFSERGVARMEIRTAVDNVRSQAVAERLGFAFEGIARSSQAIGERRVDVQVWSLLPGELR